MTSNLASFMRVNSPWMGRLPGLIMVVTVLLLAGCRTPPPIDVPAAPPLPVLPYAEDSVPTIRRYTSELTATFPRGRGRQSVKVMVILEQRPSALNIVALSPAGIPLFTTSLQADGTIATKQLTQAPGLAPERMLADLQLCLWPLSMLEAGLTAPFSATQAGTIRSLQHAGKTLIDVRYNGTPGESFTANAALPVILEHRLLGYRIDVRPLTDANQATDAGSDPPENQ